MLSPPPGGSEEDISVNFRGVSLSVTAWTIHDLNLFIHDSSMFKVKLFLDERLSHQAYVRMIHIVNSTFGHMNVRGGYNIQVFDCIVDGNTVMSKSTLLDVVGGTLSVSNSSFQHLGEEATGAATSPGLLRAVGCKIHMVSVNCSNNKAPGGLIQIQNGSELNVQNSTFINNGNISSPSSVISVKFDSSLFISDSLFSCNVASYGSWIWLYHNVSVTITDLNTRTSSPNPRQPACTLYHNKMCPLHAVAPDKNSEAESYSHTWTYYIFLWIIEGILFMILK